MQGYGSMSDEEIITMKKKLHKLGVDLPGKEGAISKALSTAQKEERLLNKSKVYRKMHKKDQEVNKMFP